VQGKREPDLTLLFEIAPQVAAQRLAGARVPDKFESQPSEFFAKVAAGYDRRAREHAARFARINGDQPREAVWSDVLAAVKTKGWLA
jgi:dTMP kinase